MDRFLTLPAEERRLAFEQTAAAQGLAVASVEKDFWVTLTLRELFAIPELAERLTFKGGTSLSKAWGLIDRFSEDIDLTFDRELFGLGPEGDPETAPSRNARQRRLDMIQAASLSGPHGRDISPGESETFQTGVDNSRWRPRAPAARIAPGP